MSLTIFQKNRKATRIGIIMLALIVIAGGGYFVYQKFIYKAPVQAAAETLQTTTARQGDIELSASGTGSYIAAATASIGFDTSGQIVEMNAVIGNKVEKGQVLARLESTSAQIAYDQAQRTFLNLTSPSAIATAENAVATAETALVSARQTLTYIISPTVFSYEQKLADAEQALIDAQKEAQSNPSAENTAKVTSAQTVVDKVQKNLNGAWYYYRNSYVPDIFTVEQRTPGSRKTTKYIAAPTDAGIASARAEYTLAQAALVEAKDYLTALKGEELPAGATGTSLNAFEQAKLDVQTAQSTLNSLQLVAPISGMITAVSAGLGDTVASGTIITISDVSKVTLDFYLDETDFDKVAVGYPVSVVFDSLPDLTFSGKVTSVDPSLSDQNGTNLIKGTAVLNSISPATRDTLLLGMSAAVDVIGGTAKNATLISVDALHEIDTDQYGVYVLKNGKLEFTVVEVGIKDSFNVVIKSGLQPGDVVSTGLLETN
jgi:HlyD family secretion protein